MRWNFVKSSIDLRFGLWSDLNCSVQAREFRRKRMDNGRPNRQQAEQRDDLAELTAEFGKYEIGDNIIIVGGGDRSGACTEYRRYWALRVCRTQSTQRAKPRQWLECANGQPGVNAGKIVAIWRTQELTYRTRWICRVLSSGPL